MFQKISDMCFFFFSKWSTLARRQKKQGEELRLCGWITPKQKTKKKKPDKKQKGNLRTPTAFLDINFKKPIPVHSHVVFDSIITKIEGRKHFTEATMLLDGVVHGTSTVKIKKKKIKFSNSGCTHTLSLSRCFPKRRFFFLLHFRMHTHTTTLSVFQKEIFILLHFRMHTHTTTLSVFQKEIFLQFRKKKNETLTYCTYTHTLSLSQKLISKRRFFFNSFPQKNETHTHTHTHTLSLSP